MKRKAIYVESLIQADIDQLWIYTQEPDYHQQWDLRFSEIRYLPLDEPNAPQRFLYRTKIGFGISIAGMGESVRAVEGKDGERTSSLKFWSDQKLSLISEGRGYWQYTPTQQGIQFKTKYDYETRFGRLGSLLDLFFRPIMGWATAWSFDCLRIWLEKKIHPVSLLRQAIVHWLIRFVLALVWIYQGLIPKLLFPQYGELQLLEQSRLFQGMEETILIAVGGLEIGFGAFILLWSPRWLYYLHIMLLLALSFISFQSDPTTWLAPFNPFTLNILLIVLSVIYLTIDSFVPKASRCRRKPIQTRRK